jgi:hypothetical protein
LLEGPRSGWMRVVSSVPFTIRGIHAGMVDLEGIVKIEGAQLVLEFRTRHALFKFFVSSAKEVRIPLSELEEASFSRRLWLEFLNLRARNLRAFSAVPGNRGCELRLRCRSAHRAAAQDLVSRLNLSLVAKEIKAMVDSSLVLPDASQTRTSQHGQTE